MKTSLSNTIRKVLNEKNKLPVDDCEEQPKKLTKMDLYKRFIKLQHKSKIIDNP